MKKTIKSTLSAATIGLFVLLGVATSDDSFFSYPFYDLTLSNESDSCFLRNVRLVNRFSRNLTDTTLIFPSIPPKSSDFDNVDSLQYLFLLFDCVCPNDTLKAQTLDLENPENNDWDITVPPCE